MPSQEETIAIARRFDVLFNQMIDQQRTKVLRIARSINSRITEDDIFDPHSFPDVSSRPDFSYEDGILAGLISAQVAIMRELKADWREGEES